MSVRRIAIVGAESTGKSNLGIAPIVGERLLPSYGDDRVVVSVACGDEEPDPAIVEAIGSTGAPVLREVELPGAVLARVAASHIRVGTFQFYAARGDVESVRKLAEYTAKNRATLEILPGSAAWSHFEMDLLPNGTATLETSYMDEDLLAETVRGFAGQIRVISPSSLSDKVRSGLKKVADLHA